MLQNPISVIIFLQNLIMSGDTLSTHYCAYAYLLLINDKQFPAVNFKHPQKSKIGLK